MEIINNIDKTLQEDLRAELHKGSKLSIAAACFSIYAFAALKKELKKLDQLRFIFTSPAFIKENTAKEKREFYIPRLSRERSIYGTEFEVRLRNELTQKAVAKECAEWMRQKAVFKSNTTSKNMPGFMLADTTGYMPINGFTTVDLGCEQGNDAYFMINKLEAPYSQALLDNFSSLWQDDANLQNVTSEIIEKISAAYAENSPDFIYFVTLYNIFNEFLADISEDVLPNEATGFKNSKIWQLLYNFQKDAALAIISKLEKYNGCILADSVGLGKTFTALAVIKYYETRNKNILVLCPKKLGDNWNTYKDNYINNPLADDRLNYDVLYHTDLGRKRGRSNGIDLSRINWGNYDLLVIDESHNFRNGGKLDDENKMNRYAELMQKVIRAGVKTKVLMLSATPVNNRFNDLKNQLQLAYEGHAEEIDAKLDTKTPVNDIFRKAQAAYNAWSKLEPEERTAGRLLSNLSFDFFKLLDAVTIARSRKHIQKYYDTAAIGSFPQRNKPRSLRPALTDLEHAAKYNDIYTLLDQLNLTIYTPTQFILPSKLEKYASLYEDNSVNLGFTQASREIGIRRLMAINMLKRLESSVHSFRLTVSRIQAKIAAQIAEINAFAESSSHALNGSTATASAPTDAEELAAAEAEEEENLFAESKKLRQIMLADMDYVSWRSYLQQDYKTLGDLLAMLADITPQHDSKLQCLKKLLREKITHPINSGNKKILIFSAFADTAEYLYKNLSPLILEEFDLHTAIVTGSVDGRSTIPGIGGSLNTVLTLFSPLSKDKKLLLPEEKAEIDVLIATDCISEGQNLQDCDFLINYDIHWNPVRIIQRFGRIDRIGSRNKVIQMVNFWPDIDLDEYINLKARVEARMKIVDMTATGDDNVLSPDEKLNLEYRKAQLQKLQDEVVDLEEMNSGINIMDLGLNEFHMDLLAYIKQHPEMERTPFGLHSVTAAAPGCPPGVIYVLKNRTSSVNINNQNRLHPFYLVYLSQSGEIICNHLDPKHLLDKLRYLCRDKQPCPELYRSFNNETNDGRNMSQLSQLLEKAIASIIETKNESQLSSFLQGGQMSFFSENIQGLDDFELICFLVIRSGEEKSC